MSISIVIATDNPIMEYQLGRFFESRYCDVSIERIGSGALLKVLKFNTDIFMYDPNHTDDSIFDIIEIIRTIKPGIRIVVLCENTSIEHIRKLSKAGVFYCALKPIQFEEMEKILQVGEKLHQREKQIL